jgi:hypothetical protein
MELTIEEIVSIANRLDEVIGNAFHDAIYNILLEREEDTMEEVSDEDIQRIKDELKKYL